MNPSEQCQRARALVGQGRTDEALQLYDRVLEAFPDHAPGYADRGTTHAMLGAHERALSDLERAMAMGLRDGWLLTTYASVLLALRRFDESLRCFDLAIELEPGHPFAYNNRATLHIERGDHAAAIADLERCLDFGPDEATRQMLERRLQGVRASLAKT
ncbi:tetratricopeptide repeat protein [Lysobacter enzymogenes]|uniref:tetratricopeptide repeat protein n=1 Tax=Lysobacter enzymogenes TaxID=69 RepID=UPI001AF1F5D6|nr:tetratricopeptide repeat protein [Lysobacter enzymogenes]QQQ01642.1 tetratricopeptide repeat protein [Lysobacter enzymogenes]